MESPGAKFKDQSSKFKDGIAGGKVQRPKFKVQRWNRQGAKFKDQSSKFKDGIAGGDGIVLRPSAYFPPD